MKRRRTKEARREDPEAQRAIVKTAAEALLAKARLATSGADHAGADAVRAVHSDVDQTPAVRGWDTAGRLARAATLRLFMAAALIGCTRPGQDGNGAVWVRQGTVYSYGGIRIGIGSVSRDSASLVVLTEIGEQRFALRVGEAQAVNGYMIRNLETQVDPSSAPAPGSSAGSVRLSVTRSGSTSTGSNSSRSGGFG
ncbi:MAG TPA: hypothetical protein VFN74_07535 [Chloroflexota bacterium]|nr:hypothetical protein [Chloroflexota bacterium]